MTSEERILVSVIVTNRNGASIISKSLNLLFNNVLTRRKDVEVIIVDDNSTDNSVKVIIDLINNVNEELRRRIKLITLNKRVGPAKARNIGFLASRGKYIAFMDNDTFSYNDWVSECVKVLESNPKVGIVQPLVLPMSPQSKSWGGGGYVTPSFYGFISKTCPNEPFYALGSALVIRRDIYELIEGFTEYLEYSHEEVDLAWKVRLLGFSVKCVSNVYVRHLGRMSSSGKSTILRQRNRLLIIVKNLQLRNSILFTLLAIAKIIFTEHPAITIRSLLSFLKNLPNALRDRVKTGVMRKRNDQEIFSTFNDIILMEILKARMYGILPYALTLGIYKLSSINVSLNDNLKSVKGN